MDAMNNKPAKPKIEKVFGWIPFGEMPVSPLLKTNFRTAGALVDANALLRKEGWQKGTDLNLASNIDGHYDEREATEETEDDSCWLRYERDGYVFALALSKTLTGSGIGGFQFAEGRELCDTYGDLSRRRLCWARWMWGWRRNPATGEYLALDPRQKLPMASLGLDNAIVAPPESLAATIRYQTEGYDMPSKYRGGNERRLVVYAAIAGAASPRNASRPASLNRLLAPFVKAIHGFDPDGFKWIEATHCPETFMQLALLAHGCGFREAADALLWCSLKDVGSRFDIPLEQEWGEIDRISTSVGNVDFHMMWTQEILRRRVFYFPRDFGADLTKLRGIVRSCCLEWLGKSKAISNSDAIGVFLELVRSAKRLPSVPHCAQLGDDEFDALARLGRRLHEKTQGEHFGSAYREALELASMPRPPSAARLRDIAVFDSFIHNTETQLLASFPNPQPVRKSRLSEYAPKEGMTHDELWRWLGTDSDGRPLFTEAESLRAFKEMPSKLPYLASRNPRTRSFVPEGGRVEVFGIDLKRQDLGVTFIRTQDPLDGEVVRAFPQIPLSAAGKRINWACLKSWIPWLDESCAYLEIVPVLGGFVNAVVTTFACEYDYPDSSGLYKITLGFFADILAVCDGTTLELPIEPQNGDKWAWREDAGIVVGETEKCVVHGLGVEAAMTLVEFLKTPFAIPVYHRAGLHFAAGTRIHAQGWLMADATVDAPQRSIYAVLTRRKN